MAQIPRPIIETVRDRTDLIEVIQRYVTLKKRGANYIGLCPFHQEKTPSFNVQPTRQIYKCFGCHASGDAFKFLQEMEGLSFAAAVKELAEAAGVTIEERQITPQERRSIRDRATLFDVMQEAACFFEEQLWQESDGATARGYLNERKITASTARDARVGYAPEGWTHLIDFLHNKGFASDLIRKAGLARVSERGDRHYDVFRHRLMFPIRDERGRVIAFGGRLLEGEGPKYINTPDTPLYHKGQVLYGLYEAKNGIRIKKRLLLVEGYFDVLALKQAGFSETAAVCGTALTANHLKNIQRLTGEVVMMLDADAGGVAAVERALPLFLATELQPWRVELPPGRDPDDLIRSEGAEALAPLLKQREPLAEWFVEHIISQHGRTAIGQKRAIEALRPVLLKLPTLVALAASLLHLRPGQLTAMLGSIKNPKQLGQGSNTPRLSTTDLDHLFWLLLHRAEQVTPVLMAVNPAVLSSLGDRQAIVAELATGKPLTSVLDDLQDDPLSGLLSNLAIQDKLYSEEQASRAIREILLNLVTPLLDDKLSKSKKQMEQTLQNADWTSYEVAAQNQNSILHLKADLSDSVEEQAPSRFLELMTLTFATDSENFEE